MLYLVPSKYLSNYRLFACHNVIDRFTGLAYFIGYCRLEKWVTTDEDSIHTADATTRPRSVGGVNCA